MPKDHMNGFPVCPKNYHAQLRNPICRKDTKNELNQSSSGSSSGSGSGPQPEPKPKPRPQPKGAVVRPNPHSHLSLTIMRDSTLVCQTTVGNAHLAKHSHPLVRRPAHLSVLFLTELHYLEHLLAGDRALHPKTARPMTTEARVQHLTQTAQNQRGQNTAHDQKSEQTWSSSSGWKRTTTPWNDGEAFEGF